MEEDGEAQNPKTDGRKSQKDLRTLEAEDPADRAEEEEGRIEEGGMIAGHTQLKVATRISRKS